MIGAWEPADSPLLMFTIVIVAVLFAFLITSLWKPRD